MQKYNLLHFSSGRHRGEFKSHVGPLIQLEQGEKKKGVLDQSWPRMKEGKLSGVIY